MDAMTCRCVAGDTASNGNGSPRHVEDAVPRPPLRVTVGR